MSDKIQIWKFPLMDDHEFGFASFVTMPSGARLLHADCQHGRPMLWAIVDPMAPVVRRSLDVIATGQCMPGTAALGAYVGTFKMNDDHFVWHLFDLGEVPA